MLEESVQYFVEGGLLSIIEVQKIDQDGTESIEFCFVGCVEIFVECGELFNIVPVVLYDGIVDDVENFGAMCTESSVGR